MQSYIFTKYEITSINLKKLNLEAFKKQFNEYSRTLCCFIEKPFRSVKHIPTFIATNLTFYQTIVYQF